MIKNIILLTKVSTRNFLENFQIFDKDKKTVNKKSMYVVAFFDYYHCYSIFNYPNFAIVTSVWTN